MKRTLSKVLVAIMLVTMWLSSAAFVTASTTEKDATRAIYVVYDNSGSMYNTAEGQTNKAWSQAAYAMEVFASMMNFEYGDIMKIFPMHDVTTEGNNGKNFISSVEITSEDDITKIHNMYTPNPGGTPYTQVHNAAAELVTVLENGEADEGWLIVLTDGTFDSDIPSDGLREDLVAKAKTMDNLKVQYLLMGKTDNPIPEGDGSIGFYSKNVRTSNEVIEELAVICNRIFTRNEYTGYVSGNVIDFDVPISKLIVFAQGKSVSINSLTSAEGTPISLQKKVEVSYSNTDGAGLTSFVKSTPVKDTSLKGQVAVFGGGTTITEGKYTLDIAGADSVKLYYEPDVKFGIGVFDEEDQIIDTVLESGDYTLKVGFVNRLTGEFISHSELLGDPKYTVSINGVTQEYTASKGAAQLIDIQADGESLELEAEVTYLSDYTDSAALSFAVCEIEMVMDGPSSIPLKSMETGNNQYTVKMTRNGEPLTQEQWDAAVLSVNAVNAEGEPFGIVWDVAKGSEVSTWTLTPKYVDEDMFKTETGDMKLTVGVTTDVDGISYTKSQQKDISVGDDKNIIDFLKRYWKELIISLILFIILLGYVPPFKRYFSPRMKKRPSIEGIAEKIGIHDMMVKGDFKRNWVCTFIPYKAEEGRLTFTPSPVKKTAKVRAAGGSSMLILNTPAFAGKENITFNGMSIPDNYKGNYRISASTIISMATQEYTYTCIPNVQKTADGSVKRAKGKKGKSKGKKRR